MKHPVTVELIARHNPCDDRFDNFKKEYPNYEGEMVDFLTLDRITRNDKIWVATRLLGKNILVRWSIKCAESVLSKFEKFAPEDKRVRDCLETLKAIPDFEIISENDLRAAEVAAEAAWAAAEAAAEAAWSAESQGKQNIQFLIEVINEQDLQRF